MPVTFFGGFNVFGENKEGSKEKSMALCCFGLELAEKMKSDEKALIEAERQ